jgi:hypothetical protein
MPKPGFGNMAIFVKHEVEILKYKAKFASNFRLMQYSVMAVEQDVAVHRILETYQLKLTI